MLAGYVGESSVACAAALADKTRTAGMVRAGQNGVTIKKTVSALVVGFYGEGVQPGDGNTVVENLGDYLAGQGI